MEHKFIFDKIETRSIATDIGNKIIVKGYAIAKDIPHIYKWMKDKTSGKVVSGLKSLFTKNAVNSINEQLRHKKVFVDALHETASILNSRSIIEQLKVKSPEITSELAQLESQLELKELPIFKVSSFEVKDDGLYVEVESNPHFAEIDESHKKYYDAITGSISDGYLNGFSINFRTTDSIEEEGMEKINNVDVYGISIVPDASLGKYSGITEVAVRSLVELRSEKMEEKKEGNEKIQEKPQHSSEDIQKIVERMVSERLAEEKKQQEKLTKEQQLEQEKKQQSEMLNNLQKELEELKKSAGAKQGSRSDIGDDNQKKFDPELLKQKIGELSFYDLARLQAEFGDKLPAYTIGSSPAKSKRDPSYYMEAKPVDHSMQDLYRQMKAKQSSDTLISREL